MENENETAQPKVEHEHQTVRPPFRLHSGTVFPEHATEISEKSLPASPTAAADHRTGSRMESRFKLDGKHMDKDVVDKLTEYDFNDDGEIDAAEVRGTTAGRGPRRGCAEGFISCAATEII